MLLVLGLGVVTEEERYTTPGAGAEMYIVGTTTNSIIVEPVIRQFRETKDYYAGFCSPSLDESAQPAVLKKKKKEVIGFFVVAKDASVCEVGLSESEFLARISSLSID